MAHNILGLLLCLVPYWKLRSAHLIFYWWLISEMLQIHKPFEYGINFNEHIAKTVTMIVLGYYTHYTLNLIGVLGCFVFSQILWPTYVKNEAYEADASDLVIGVDVPNWMHVLATMTLAHCLLSYTGYIYVASEAPRISNEKLLNNLDEGVCIIEENDSSILFLNKAAKSVNSKLKGNSLLSMTEKDDESFEHD